MSLPFPHIEYHFIVDGKHVVTINEENWVNKHQPDFLYLPQIRLHLSQWVNQIIPTVQEGKKAMFIIYGSGPAIIRNNVPVSEEPRLLISDYNRGDYIEAFNP